MKKTACVLAMAVVSALVVSGCVQVTYRKTVATHLDADGKVKETVITEEVIEPHSESARIQSISKVDLKHIQQ